MASSMKFLSNILCRSPHLRKSFQIFYRKLLTSSYGCNETWNDRLKSPSFRTLSASDLGTKILHRLSNNASVSPLDYDIFINKLQQTEKVFLDFAEKIIIKFQRTQNALSVLPSSSHAIIQAYMHFNEYTRLLDLLHRRTETGIFLDEISANLLLTYFVNENDYTAALNIIWELCLQSHFDFHSIRPYILALWLHTISSCLKSGAYFERENLTILEDSEDDDDTDYQRVPYLRNPNYDNWFDIHRPRLQLGHCFLSLAKAIENNFSASSFSPDLQCSPPLVEAESLSQMDPRSPDPRTTLLFDETQSASQSFRKLSATTIAILESMPQTLRFLAFALLENLPEMSSIIQNASTKPEILQFCDAHVLDAIEKLIESSQCRPDNSEIKRGEPFLNTESDISKALSEFKAFSTSFKPSSSLFYPQIENIVTEIISNSEILSDEQNRVRKLYTEFSDTRERIWNDSLEKIKRENAISDVKTRLRNLVDEEERLTYFENVDVIEKKAWLAPRTRVERHWSRFKEWKKELRDYNAKKNISRRSLSEF